MQLEVRKIEESDRRPGEKNPWTTHCKTLLQEALKLGKLAQERGKAWAKAEPEAYRLENRLNRLLIRTLNQER